MTAWATCAGEAVVRARVLVTQWGAWHADVDFEEAPDVDGRVRLVLGQLELEGTVEARSNGTHAGQRRLRMLAGAGGWGTELAAADYANDLGVLARQVAEDAARLAGESIAADGFAPAADRIGPHYARSRGPASRVLEDVVGAVPWWVGLDGLTRVGARATSSPDASSYQVLDYDPRTRIVTLAVDDLRSIGIGSILAGELLDEPQTVRELDIDATPEAIRIYAWTGGSSSSRSRLDDAARGVVGRYLDPKLLAPWRYRVVRVAGERLELQSVRREAGVPDVLPISMWPGVAGTHAEPTLGAEVLVQFIEGDRRMPFVSHFVGKDGTGWSPTSLTLDASSIKAGENATKEVAWKGELHTELQKIATSFANAQSSPSGGALLWVPPTSQYQAPLTASGLGTTKLKAE